MNLAELNKKKVLYITLFCGFWGGHHFYLGAKRQGYIYLWFCWSIVPAFASTFDLASMVFKNADDNVFHKVSEENKNMVSSKTIKHLAYGAVVIALWIFYALTS